MASAPRVTVTYLMSLHCSALKRSVLVAAVNAALVLESVKPEGTSRTTSRYSPASMLQPRSSPLELSGATLMPTAPLGVASVRVTVPPSSMVSLMLSAYARPDIPMTPDIASARTDAARLLLLNIRLWPLEGLGAVVRAPLVRRGCGSRRAHRMRRLDR